MTAPLAHASRLTIVGTLLAIVVSLLPVRAASAEPGGRVSGTVTGGGAELANVWVTLTPVTDAGTQEGAPVVAITDGSGRYEFSAVDAPSVKIHVMRPLTGQYVTTYWPAAYSFAEAGIVEITGRWVTADLDLPAGGSVAGQVRDAMSGAPIGGVQITATPADGPTSAAVATGVTSEVTGAFSIPGLPPVPIQLAVEPPPDSAYLPPDPATGQGLRVDGSSDTTGTVIRLRPGGEIRGRVLDDSGAPVARALVRAVGCTPMCQSEAISDSSGAYRLLGVNPGTGLKVEAAPVQGLLGRGSRGGGTATPATTLTIEEGDVIDDVDIVLIRPAHVTVQIGGASGAGPLRLIVWLRTAGRVYGQYFAHRPGDGSGLPGGPIRLRTGPVPPGEYAVSISPGTEDPGHLPTRWMTSSPGAPTGRTIQLAAGQEAETVVQLGNASGTAEANPREATPERSNGWPGLDEGFLRRPQRTDPFAGADQATTQTSLP